MISSITSLNDALSKYHKREKHFRISAGNKGFFDVMRWKMKGCSRWGSNPGGP